MAPKTQTVKHNGNKCDKCGRKPYVWTLGPYHLCVRCYSVARAEHRANCTTETYAEDRGLQKGHVLAVQRTGDDDIRVDTTDWVISKGAK